jgi:4-hydroxythreonine-4-phosphate dehydrogenase
MARTAPLVFVSAGCPAGIGPEVAVAAARKLHDTPIVLVGDIGTLLAAAALVHVGEQHLLPFDGKPPRPGSIGVVQAGPALTPKDRTPGAPSRAAGASQLAAIETAFRLVKEHPGSALATGPVSKAAIAESGVRGAAKFKGHTEWLQQLDGAKTSVMCFVSPKLSTSLVTTHVPIARVPALLTPEGVAEATVRLAELLLEVGRKRPRVAVASLNPHAGENEMFGNEEARALVPGVALARKRMRGAEISGPIGAETAYRYAYAGKYDGVVAMYHDQATIPMKLVAFGDAVNVTMGLSVPRTSVDHGTAYDIAWQGKADPSGMVVAVELAEKLAKARAGARSRRSRPKTRSTRR